jgi:hypothetical protein
MELASLFYLWFWLWVRTWMLLNRIWCCCWDRTSFSQQEWGRTIIQSKLLESRYIYTLCFLSIFGLLSIHTHVWISMFVSNYCWKKNNDLAYMKIVNLCRSKFIICGVPCWSWFFLYKHFFWSNHFRGSFCGYVFFVHKIR